MADKRGGSNELKAAGEPTALKAEFPAPRYFQVHFEYLDSLLLDAAKTLEVLRTEVAEVYRVMQTDQDPHRSGMDQFGMHEVDTQAKPVLRMEPRRNTKRSKQPPPGHNARRAGTR